MKHLRLWWTILLGAWMWCAPPARAEETLHMARATWDTGWFQAEIYRELVQQLGYRVPRPATLENDPAYDKINRGDIDFWPNGWFPGHQRYFLKRPDLQPVGKAVASGALQGVLIDKKTARSQGITHLKDLRDPAMAALFDWDGDGKADLIGCDAGWSCYGVLEDLLDQWDLRKTVTHVSRDYSPLMFEVLRRYQAEKPVLFYTWTPNWTTGVLRPERDVVWLAGTEAQKAFSPNDIRVVANRRFLQTHPDLKSLFEDVVISLADISAQNALFLEGEDTEADIHRHAQSWLKTHAVDVKRWLDKARSLQSSVQKQAQSQRVAQAVPPVKLRVLVKRFEPLVTFEKLNYSGFALDLWQEMAQEMGADVELRAVNSLAKMIDEVENGSGDVGISGVSITAEREARIDFSQPFYASGLQILVKAEDSGRWAFVATLMQALFSQGLLLTLGFLALCLFVAANVLWWFERNHYQSDFSSHYGRGIIDALWWAAVTVTTVGDGKKTPRNVSGKIFAIVWMFAGYFVLAYFTASISSSLTLERLEGRIRGPEDLRDKRVASVSHSQAADFLQREGIPFEAFGDVEQAIVALQNQAVDALVYHEPVLRYYASHRKDSSLKTVGDIFEPQNYGFVLPTNSPHREAIDRALLKLKEEGRYAVLHRKWFGK